MFVWEGGGTGWGDYMSLGESFAWGHEEKTIVENEFSGNININFKIYPNYGDVDLKENWEKTSGKG